MARKAPFNPSLTMPVIDIIVALLLIVATGYFWLHTKGEAKLEAALDDLRQARERNAAELTAAKEDLSEAQLELTEITNERDAKAQYVIFLEDQVELERQKIEDARRKEEEYTDLWLDLRSEVQRARDRRRAYQTDILETETKIAEASSRNADLYAQIDERNARIDQLDGWIREARTELERNPPSRFPEKSSLASVLDISDPSNAVVFSLERDLTGVGGLHLGLLGSLGLGDGSETSIKEGGIYANLPLMPRRASIDFQGGISQLVARGDDQDKTGPFAGATFRLAPTRRERFFLLAGTRYSHEELGLRLGVGLGRR